MKSLHQHHHVPLFLIYVLFSSYFLSCDASITVTMSSGDINKDSTPALGRGYSPGTGIYFSKCLAGTKTTTTTFDYDFFLFSLSASRSSSEIGGGSIKERTSYIDVVKKQKEMKENNEKSEMQMKVVVSVISVDKYYTSVDESASALDTNVQDLLQGYGFLSVAQACGPYYIRSIRRSSEVLSFFVYFSGESSESKSKESENLIQSVRRSGKGSDSEETSASTSSWKASLMIIYISAKGLDLNTDQGGNLIAADLEQYNEAMTVAFSMMINPLAGQILSMEIVPWSSNPAFQGAVGVMDDIALYNDNGVVKKFPNALKQIYFIANSEFLVKLNLLHRMKNNQILELTRCMGLLYGMNELERCGSYTRHIHEPESCSSGGYISFTQNSILYDGTAAVEQWDELEAKCINILRLKYLLDGYAETDVTTHDTPLVEKVTTEFFEWTNGFFKPCMQRMVADNYNMGAGTMYTTMWTDHAECKKFSCMLDGAVYDSTMNDGAGGCSLQSSVTTRWTELVYAFCTPEPQYKYGTIRLWIGSFRCGITRG
mmetsp:Transcript_23457/g.53540  ORF Transcript_23457/g.53540 Transcript_23457/m.53540 type:complete len:543 (-) Transcript_23457:264-1892(-)